MVFCKFYRHPSYKYNLSSLYLFIIQLVIPPMINQIPVKTIRAVSSDTYDGLAVAGGMGEGHIPSDAIIEMIRVVKPGKSPHMIHVLKVTFFLSDRP